MVAKPLMGTYAPAPGNYLVDLNTVFFFWRFYSYGIYKAVFFYGLGKLFNFRFVKILADVACYAQAGKGYFYMRACV